MAQLTQIRLQRYDAQPWGFRLQGGKDFAAPLVVQKINGGSLAEQAGLLPGDAVIKINDIDVYNLRHKDAQDLVVRSGNNFIVTVQRGGLTWRPNVTPTGQLPSPNQYSHQIPAVTKTSLAHKPQEVHHIGSGYNNSARPFNSVNGNDGQVKSIVNKQYNTPVGIYSDENIAETLSAQAEVLAGGVLGINFKKNEKQYQAEKSEVLKFLHEEETGDHQEPAPYNPPQIINNHIPSQNQSNVTRHVTAPIDRPKPPSTGGLPAGQNICTECERLIVGVFVRIKDKNLHVECFKCATCGSSLKNQGYYNFNNKLYCDIHARLAAMQNPPSGTDGYVPVPIKPNTKLSASTISAALNSIGFNGSPTNGNTTPSYSAPPSNTETSSIPDLPLPPPPSPTQLQQFQIQDTFCNSTALNNHSRTNSSLSTASSSSLSLSPYSSSNGINNSSCSPINTTAANSIENSLNNNNGYNNTSSPGHSRQQSTSSSTGSGNATDFHLPPPPPPPLPQQQYSTTVQQQQQNSMTINQSGKQNENDMNSNNRYAPSSTASSNNHNNNKTTNGVSSNVYNKYLKEFTNYLNNNSNKNTEHSTTPTPTTTSSSSDGIKMLYFPQGVAGEASEMVNVANGQSDEGNINPTDARIGQGNEQFQYVTLHGNVIRSVIPPGKGVSVNYKVNQGFARPYGAPAPAAAPKSPTSYPPPTQGGNWGQPRPVQQQQHQQQQQQQQQQLANNPYATLPRSHAGPQESNTNTANKSIVPMTSSTLPRVKPSVVKPKPSASQTSDATHMLTDSISKVNIGNMNNFMAEAGKIISNMLEARLANNSKNNSNSDLTSITGGSNSNTLTRSPMVVRKRFELDDFKNVDPTAPADLKPTQMVVPTEQKVQQPSQQKTVMPVIVGDVLTQQNHHMKNLIEICDAKRLLGPHVNGNKPISNPIVKAPVVAAVTAPTPPPQPPQQQKAQPQTLAPTPTQPTELAPLETVIFRNKNRSANKNGELSTHATDRRSYIERDGQSESAPVFEISVKPMGGGNNTEDEAGIDETKAVVSQLLKDGKRPICCQCDKEISRGPFITALGRIWCPDHFMCVNANCRRPLQDIGFVEEKGDLYCEYCFEKYLAPTCSKCGGKIKGDCLNAIGRHFHPECFTCAHCGKLFGNTPFFLEEGMAYCEADWNELFTTKCFACGFPVEAGDRWVEALNHNYHSQCFNCTFCKKNLEGQSFYNKGGRPFCKNHAR